MVVVAWGMDASNGLVYTLLHTSYIYPTTWVALQMNTAMNKTNVLWEFKG
jgi:hypothetical protein